MYISKVNIQGFKSFLNKTSLTFGRGITCVVGPNGCGKTNIVDSIRWILGEQKSSVLRSNKMEDVIFNGTRKRKPVSFCESSIMLHNEGRLPIEYTDIEITRRLFRSGESEYLINKVPCRLKDINNLFMDTGMGSGAYSVIELKMIETILSQNAGDRKHLIEEAAGINQYKQQRHQTYKKLKATKTDLDRVNDILIELEKNVKSLTLQLKKFDRHKKLINKLKSKSIILAAHRYHNFTSEIDPILIDINSKKNNYSKLSSQMSIDEELEKTIQNRYDNARSKMETLDLNLKDTAKKISEKNRNIIVWTENKKSNEGRSQQNTDESEQIQIQQFSLDSQLNEMKKSLSIIEPVILKKQEIYNKELEIFKNLKQDSEIQIKNHQSKQAEFDAHLNMIFQEETAFKLNENSLKSQSEFLEKLELRRAQFKSRDLKMLEEISSCKREITAKEESSNNILINLDKYKLKQLKFDSEIAQSLQEISYLRIKNDELNSKVNLFKSILKSRGDSATGLNYIEENKLNYKGIIGILSDLIEIPEEYHMASEAVMGDLKNAVVVDKISTAQNILNDLKNNNGGSLTLISLDKVGSINIKKKNQFLKLIQSNTKINDLVNHLYGHVEIVDTMTASEITSGSIVTKSGDLIKNNYQLKGSSSKNNISVLGKKKEIKQIKVEIKKNQNKLDKLIFSQKDKEKKIANLNKEIIKIEKELEEEVSEKQKLEIELSRKETSLIHLQEMKKENKNEIGKSKIQIDLLKIKIDQNKDKVRDLNYIKVNFKQKIEEISKKTEIFRQKINQQQEVTQEKQLQLLESEKEKNSIELRINSIDDRIAENKRRLDRIQNINKQLLKTNEDLDKKLLLEKELKQNLINEQQNLSNNKSATDKEYNEAYQELKQLQQNMRSHHKLKEERIFDIQEMELKVSNLKNSRKNLVDNIYKEFAISIEELEEIDHSEVDVKELIYDIQSIKESIERTGPINMAIQDEYEKENERLIFLKEQVDDLVEAEKTLIETISRIDKQARDKFLKTFGEIASNFKSTFKRFFDGGEAEICLEDGVDPLEADVKIIAKPPGKRTQSLKMLSAGEKALTAISLLFAIYLVKPSPFCILDEVDAPLDDRNIKKYTKVLREFAKNTQFIVITHNKLTMEAADYLYGVTQEEEGVSKLVSVKFKDNPELNFK